VHSRGLIVCIDEPPESIRRDAAPLCL